MASDYKQFDSKWGSHVIAGTSSTVKGVGCGPTSISDILNSVIPPDVADYMGPKGYVGSSGSTYDGIVSTCQHFGIGCTEITSSYGSERGIAGQSDNPCFSQLAQHLMSGKVAILLMGGTKRAGAPDNYWTKGGHYIAAIRIKGTDSVMIYDPGSGERSGWYPIVGQGKGRLSTYTRRIFLLNATPGTSVNVDNYQGGAVLEGSSGGGASHSFDTTATGEFTSDNLISNALSGAGGVLGNVASGIQGGLSSLASTLSSVFSDVAEAFALRFSGGYVSSSFEVAYETVTTEIERDEIRTIDDFNTDKNATNLLSYPSLVESPYIILTVGEYKFGTYSKTSVNGALNINYPNYIDGMTVEKINGQVNKYTITMKYQIQYGDDPNLLDRIFSSVGYGLVKISYGDWASPTFVYREEEAIITNLTSNIDFGNSSITYILKCTSNALVLASGYFDFEREPSKKPSEKILEIVTNPKYGLQEVFTGMPNAQVINSHGLIASDDKAVEIEAKHGIDALSYINYLVTCMSSITNTDDEPIKDSMYFMTIYDDTWGEDGLNGSYFKVTKVESSRANLSTPDTYSIDIGFPTNNMVMSFNVLNNNSWSLLYNYSDTVNTSEYMYSINNEGKLITQYSPAVATSAKNFKMTESQKTWWTNMTQFPIKADLTIKGLVRSAMLMTYIRVNAYFYGQRHITSGLYIVTKQVDTIGKGGYRTTLSLLRIAGDNDYIVKVKKQVTSTLPVSIVAKNVEAPSGEVTEKINALAKRVENTLSGIPNTLDNVASAAKDFLGSYQGGAVTEDGMYYDSAVPSAYEDSDYSSDGGGASRSFDVPSDGSIASKVWYTLMSVIGNPYGVAAVMGNLDHESDGFVTTRREYPHSDWETYKKWYPMYTDASYTQAIDSGKISREEFRHPLLNMGKPKNSYGYGLVQWTDDRKYGLYDKAKSMGKSIGDIEVQLRYIMDELSGTKYHSGGGVMDALKRATNLEEPTRIFFNRYEGINDSSGPNRLACAKRAYQTYGGRAYGM